MKKIVYILSVALAAAACSKTESPLTTPETVDSAVSQVEFTASFGEAPVVKTQLSGTSVLWNAGDEIKILWDGGSTTAQADKAGATANFPATVGNASEYFAVYPSSASVSLSSGTLAVVVPSEQNGAFEDANIAIAKTSAQSMVFKNLCALGKFTLTRSDIARVVFRGHENAPLAGNATLSIDGSGIPSASSVASPVDSIVITPSSGSAFAAGDYYFSAIPGNLSAVSFKLTTVSGNTILGKAKSSSATLARSEALNFKTLDASGTPTTITLKFDFTGEAPSGWPTGSAAANTLTDSDAIYSLDGTDYTFKLRFSTTTDTKARGVYWTSNANYGGRLIINGRCKYAGLPAIPGYKLIQARFWRVRAGSSDKGEDGSTTRSGIAIADEVLSVASSSNSDLSLVTLSGESNKYIIWKGGMSSAKTLYGPYTYNLEGTSAGANYYAVLYYLASASYDSPAIGKIEVTYEKVTE